MQNIKEHIKENINSVCPPLYEGGGIISELNSKWS